MKRRITTAVIIFLFSTLFLRAQDKELRIGMKLTPEISIFNSSLNIVKYDPKFSLGGSLQLIKEINRHISFESGVSFVNRGWKWEVELRDDNGKFMKMENFRYNYNYLGVPLLIRINMKSLYLSAGPSLDFFIFYYDRPQDVEKIEAKVNTLNISLPVSLGHVVKISDKVSASLELRYNPLLNRFYSSGLAKQNNQNLGVGLGATYKLK